MSEPTYMFIIGFLLPSILSENSLTESAFGLFFYTLGDRFYFNNYFIEIPVYYWILSAIKLGALAYLSKSGFLKGSISSWGLYEATPLRPWPRPSFFLVIDVIWSTFFQSSDYFPIAWNVLGSILSISMSYTILSRDDAFCTNSATFPY